MRMRFALKGRLFAQNVDKSGKIVDNRLKMCKSTFEIYAYVLPVSCEMQVLHTLWVVGDYLRGINVVRRGFSTPIVDKFSTVSTFQIEVHHFPQLRWTNYPRSP